MHSFIGDRPHLTFLLSAVVVAFAGTISSGQISFSDVALALTPPSGDANRMMINVSAGGLVSDSDTTDFTGGFLLDLDVDGNPGTGLAASAFSITGGEVFASDLSFSLIIISATTSGLGGTPGTLSPPSSVTNGSFDGSEHFVNLNQGEISVADTTIDFSTAPITAAGTGVGTLQISEIAPVPGFDVFEVALELPVMVDEEIQVDTTLGPITTTLMGDTRICAVGTISVPTLVGDYDRDGSLGCGDIDLLGTAIRDGSLDLAFDANGDGQVSDDDYLFWVTDVKGTVTGDANFDFVNDISDFNRWSENKFTAGTGWCEGDFTGDGFTDVTDFNLWNEFSFTAAGSTVPEPHPFLLLLTLGLGPLWRRGGAENRR